ncbi:hypothetical protein FXO38_25731 [Capsicum annuum]|nr:hypothetical protein FXO38_25731 [Capsicum annuum]KAF3635382.1 hypothetical protein FXO37_26027 [Capsicum annuum]
MFERTSGKLQCKRSMSWGLKSAGVSEVVSRDLSRTPDSAKPLTYDNDRFIGKKAPPNRFRNVMSPIEEEEIGEQMTVSPAMEAGSQPIELFAAPHASSSLISETLFIGRSSSSLDSEKINPACRSSNSYGSPNSIVIHYEEDLRANVEEVFDPDAAQYDSATSPDKPAGYIVLDFRRKMISMIGMVCQITYPIIQLYVTGRLTLLIYMFITRTYCLHN